MRCKNDPNLFFGIIQQTKSKKRSRDLGDIPHPKVSRARRVVDDEPKDSTTPPPRLVRLIVSNTSSGGSTHCSDGSSDAKADFLFRGPPVCLIRDIRDKRMNAMLAQKRLGNTLRM